MTKRRISILFAAALWLVALPALAGENTDDGIQWYSYEDGMAKAAETGRPVVIDFHADWCKWCVELDKKTFSDARVIKVMNEQFVPISVDTDKEKVTAGKYAVQSLPTMWFLESDGKRIDMLPGFVDADFFSIVLDYIGSGSYKSTDFEAFMASKS
jgi:thioredoxin-related protein